MRLKDFIISAMLLLAAFSFSGCHENNTIIDNSWNSGTLTVKDEVLFEAGTSMTLNIKASVKPTLTCDADWLKIGEVKSLSTGIYSTELKVEVNVTGETRSAKIIVSAGKETATVTVSQLSSDVVEVKSVDPKGDLDPEGGILNIKYAATGTPAANLPEWISVVETRSLNEGVMTLTYQPNNTGKVREGMIVLAVGKDAVANVTVRQPAIK